MKLKKIINQWLCQHKTINPIRLVDTIEYTYKNGLINNKSKHQIMFTITYICQDCGKKIDSNVNFRRKYFN